MNFINDQLGNDKYILSEICRLAKINKAANVGTFTGQSAIIIGEHVSERLYCVDNFGGNGVDRNPLNKAYGVHSVRKVLSMNLVEAGLIHRTTILEMDSVEAAKHVDGPLDFVFIDCDHRYSSVKADIEAYLPKIRKGGIISGHDFEKPASEVDRERMIECCEQDKTDRLHYGVIRAVSESFPNVSHLGRCWWVKV